MRLERLAVHGVPVVVDARALLLFVFQRALADRAPEDRKLAWANDVAGLLTVLEAQTPQLRCA
jgi:hypothetical protein